MKALLNKPIVLELNASWMPITIKAPKAVFENFYTDNLLGLDIDYTPESIESGNFDDITNMRPCTWAEWMELPVRDHDLSISTARGKIRVPSIVVCASYNKMPKKAPRLSKKNIMLRDGMRCQYTGIEYPKAQLNIDHVLPQSRGGPNSWTNLVTCHKDLNSKKDNRTPEEAGLRLIRPPKRPSITQIFFADKQRDPKWGEFLKIFDN